MIIESRADATGTGTFEPSAVSTLEPPVYR
jgi:hypothetical protein